MFGEYIDTLSSSSSPDILQDICDLIEQDAFLFPPMNEQIQSKDFLSISNDTLSNQPFANLNSNEFSTEEIPFDQTEWLIHDPSTNRVRPPKLFEFLQLLLNNLRYMSYATWLNKNEGLFQIHKPDEVAQLWNQVKIRHTNRKMTFENLARGIRYYYATGQMIGTHKRYTYRFVIQK